MSVKIGWVIDQMEVWAPPCTAEGWDNVGLLVGDAEAVVERVLVALDANGDVIREAVGGGYGMIVTHHPLIFNPISRITAHEPLGRKLLALVGHGIGLFSAHTNLDAAVGGTNDLLFERIGLLGKKPMPDSIGCIGEPPCPMTFIELVSHVKHRLGLPLIRFAGVVDKPVHMVGICAGDASAARYGNAAHQAGCDVYITGDLRHHNTQDMVEMGLSLIDATHFESERPIVPAIVAYLSEVAAKSSINLLVKASQTEKQALLAL